MNVQSLAQSCADAIGRGSKRIALVLPGYASGNTRRLCGRRGPAGEVVSDTGTDERPESLVAFDPIKVLAWMAANGLVKVEAAKPAV